MEGRITRQRKGERGDETTASGKKSGRSQQHLEPTKAAGNVKECVFGGGLGGVGCRGPGMEQGNKTPKMSLLKGKFSQNVKLIYSPIRRSKAVQLGTQKQKYCAGCAFLCNN